MSDLVQKNDEYLEKTSSYTIQKDKDEFYYCFRTRKRKLIHYIFDLELIYLYFPPSSHLIYVCFCPVGLSLL